MINCGYKNRGSRILWNYLLGCLVVASRWRVGGTLEELYTVLITIFVCNFTWVGGPAMRISHQGRKKNISPHKVLTALRQHSSFSWTFKFRLQLSWKSASNKLSSNENMVMKYIRKILWTYDNAHESMANAPSSEHHTVLISRIDNKKFSHRLSKNLVPQRQRCRWHIERFILKRNSIYNQIYNKRNDILGYCVTDKLAAHVVHVLLVKRTVRGGESLVKTVKDIFYDVRSTFNLNMTSIRHLPHNEPKYHIFNII